MLCGPFDTSLQIIHVMWAFRYFIGQFQELPKPSKLQVKFSSTLSYLAWHHQGIAAANLDMQVLPNLGITSAIGNSSCANHQTRISRVNSIISDSVDYLSLIRIWQEQFMPVSHSFSSKVFFSNCLFFISLSTHSLYLLDFHNLHFLIQLIVCDQLFKYVIIINDCYSVVELIS